jgi:hypothetical protein
MHLGSDIWSRCNFQDHFGMEAGALSGLHSVHGDGHLIFVHPKTSFILALPQAGFRRGVPK